MRTEYLKQIESSQRLQKEAFTGAHKNPFDGIDTLYFLLKSALEKREPFSMVRFGDGEGRILGYPDIFDNKVVTNQVLTYQYGAGVLDSLKGLFGNNYIEEAMAELKAFLKQAIESADIVGAPSWLHFRAPVDQSNLIAQAAQATALLDVIRYKPESVELFDHFIFKPFNQKGLFAGLLKDLGYMGIISHTDISDTLKDLFHIGKVDHIRIPGHQTFMKSDELHYPLIYKDIVDLIRVPKRGDVFLVAAGYLGKLYCTEVKKKGGIAIDIGSIFDGWIGRGRTDAMQNKKHRLTPIEE